MKLSITLPSIREAACWRTLANIAATTYGAYEVIVVSPFPVRAPDVVWVREDQPTGGSRAQAIAGRHASGDLLVAMSDDRAFVEGWDIDLRAAWTDRELATKGRLCMGLRHVRSRLVGTCFGLYYPYFPVIRRESGLWYDPAYRHNFGDCDLGMRVWNAGARCEFGPEVLEVHPEDAAQRRAPDIDEEMRRFIQRWAPVYGRGWDCRTLRGFNIDVDPDRFWGQRTIRHNRPDFPSLTSVAGGFSLPGLARRAIRYIGRPSFEKL